MTTDLALQLGGSTIVISFGVLLLWIPFHETSASRYIREALFLASSYVLFTALVGLGSTTGMISSLDARIWGRLATVIALLLLIEITYLCVTADHHAPHK